MKPPISRSTPEPIAYKLPAGLRATFSIRPDGSYAAAWTPHLPTPDSIGRRGKFLRAYRAARNDFLRDMAHTLNRSIAVVDLGDGEISSELIEPPASH